MWIHGYFHLIGYDHKKIKDFKKMDKKENLVLNYFHKAILTSLIQNKILIYIIPFIIGLFTSYSLPPYSFFIHKFYYISYIVFLSIIKSSQEESGYLLRLDGYLVLGILFLIYIGYPIHLLLKKFLNL